MPKHKLQTLAGPLCRSSLIKVCGVCWWTVPRCGISFSLSYNVLERSAFVPVLLILYSTVDIIVALDTRTRLIR